MAQPRSRIGSELLPVFLILCSLAGTWSLVVSMHRRAAAARKAVVKSTVPQPTKAAVPKVVVQAPPAPSTPEPTPAPAVEDPTRAALARLGAEEATQLLEARAADRKAEALERARGAAVAESERVKRRERVIRDQIDSLAQRARSIEREADTLALERDVLARERDLTKAALAKASNRSSFAVLPNRAPNGTWRRPIVIECKNGSATLQPRGPSFSLLELSSLLGTRSSPIVLAVVRELIRVQGSTGPDGTPAVPYIFFVVRPDGIRPYYEARARLESLGIAFGYELVEQDLQIDFPDLDHPDEWDGSAPLVRFPLASLDDRRGRAAPHGDGATQSADDYVWTTKDGEQPGAGSDPFGDGIDGAGRGRGSSPEGEFLGDSAGASRGANGGFAPRGGSTGAAGRPLAGTPGMLPPSFGPHGPPRTSMAMGEPAGFPPAEGAPAPPGSFGPPSPAAGGVPANREAIGNPGREPATLDPVPLLGRRAGQAERFRRSGLRPGEPGAPPEDWPSLGSDGPGSGHGQQASASIGSTSPSGTTLSGSPAGSVSGTAGGGEPEPGASGAEGDPGSRRRGPLRISVPMEIVVACGPGGVTIHPGGYQLSRKTLNGKDDVLTRSLQAIVHRRQLVDPMIRPVPSIRYLVEPGGEETYQAVRRQTVLSGLNWPTVLQVSDTRVLDFLPRERF